MRTLLVAIAVILIIAWVIGFLIYHIASGLIHILLVVAVIAILIRLIKGKGI
ncbi:MAG TPA: lmo0937 family membrane protein [Chitinophagaceae bacterium]|jgi:hypothetical protein|nr:lmo0937 family membrane protein [Chitinophagaceae bacterium]